MTANEEKRRHLEENSNDKMMYETKIAEMNTENRSLQSQVQEMLTRFEEMEDKIRELTLRESEKRHALDSDLQLEQ